MQGMFKANGGCGYVKKPEFLIQEVANNEAFDPKRRLPVKQILKVSVPLSTLLKENNLFHYIYEYFSCSTTGKSI
jgi:hypothetical protein